MKHLLSAITLCLAIAFISCGKDGDNCSGDFVGEWSGDISCTDSPSDSIIVSISTLMGDTLAINSNGEQLTGVLDGCDLTLIPVELESSIFGTLTITGSANLNGDNLVFMMMRSGIGEPETCTFRGMK